MENYFAVCVPTVKVLLYASRVAKKHGSGTHIVAGASLFVLLLHVLSLLLHVLSLLLHVLSLLLHVLSVVVPVQMITNTAIHVPMRSAIDNGVSTVTHGILRRSVCKVLVCAIVVIIL
jgi:hypothetical protein